MSEAKRARWLRKAESMPYRVFVSRRLGHVLGIPPGLRDYRDPLFDLLPTSVRIAVEIGTFQGWFAWRCMKYLPPDALLFCVDSFEGELGKYSIRCWKQNLRPWFGRRAYLRRGLSSIEAMRWGRTPIDFLFIDGDHREQAVREDLEGWVPKVRPGGLVMGHDIEGPSSEGVRRAVVDYTARAGIPQIKSSVAYSFTGRHETAVWYFTQPGEAK